MDYKLNIHFGKYKIKSILCASKFKRKNIKNLTTKYGDTKISQHSKVKYLGCLLDETMSDEAMALIVLGKINNKLKCIHRKNVFLIPALRPLCNVLIQPRFYYTCYTWYLNQTRNLKLKIQTSQKKCMRFCL